MQPQGGMQFRHAPHWRSQVRTLTTLIRVEDFDEYRSSESEEAVLLKSLYQNSMRMSMAFRSRGDNLLRLPSLSAP